MSDGLVSAGHLDAGQLNTGGAGDESNWAIVVPVRAGEETLARETLSSLLNMSVADAPVLVLSAQNGADGMRIEHPKARALVYAAWPGHGEEDPFYAALAHGMKKYSEEDIVVVMPGVALPEAWDRRLAWAAKRRAGIASASPLCDVSALHRLGERALSAESDPALVNKAVYSLGERRGFELPVLLCACVYLRRACLESAWPIARAMRPDAALPFYATLSRAFQRAGAFNVVTDHVFVTDVNRTHLDWMSASETWDDVQKTAQVHPLLDLRHAFNDAREQGLLTTFVGYRTGPTQLHIAHSWGGGLGQWVADYCRHDERGTNLVLRSVGTWGAFGEALELFAAGDLNNPIERWQLRYPIRGTAIAHMQYGEILHDIVQRFGVDLILLSSLVGHSLDVLRAACDVIVVHHDYYPFCPAFNIAFDGVCLECDEAKLGRCFAENEHNRFFINVEASEVVAVRDEYARLTDDPKVRLVAPSQSVERNLKRLWPAILSREFNVIPHGIRFRRESERLDAADDAAGKLRIVVLGRILPHKGKSLLYEALPYLTEFAEITMLGCGESGDAFAGKPGVRIISDYALHDLEGELRDIDPHVGALLSVMPETFSYALSELMLMGIPVVATRIGSFEDRIRDGDTGFLIAPEAGALVEAMRRLNADRRLLRDVRVHLANFTVRDPAHMVADYQALIGSPEYRDERYFAESVARRVLRQGRMETVEMGDMLIVGNPAFKLVFSRFLDYTLRKFAASPRFNDSRAGKTLKYLLGPPLRAVIGLLKKWAG